MQTCQNPNHDCNSPAMYAVQSVVNDSKLGEIVLEERVACPYCADNAAPSEEGVEIRKQAL